MTAACWSVGLAWLGPQPQPLWHPLQPSPPALPLPHHSLQGLPLVLPHSLPAHPWALLPTQPAHQGLALALLHSRLPPPASWPPSRLCQPLGCLAPVPRVFCLTSRLAHSLQTLGVPLSPPPPSHLMSTW